MAQDNAQQKQRKDAVDIALKQIHKNFGDGAIMHLGQKMENMYSIPAISTQCLPLDLALGVGGVPRGRIIEIYGPEASGKTTVCLHVIAEAQKNGGNAAFIDAEHALDPERAAAIGVNLEDLLIAQPDYGEQALEIAETLIRSGGLDVIVIDSVAALVPKSEIEGEMEDHSVGTHARLMSKAMRKLAAVINKSNTVVIFTNQLRLKIGVMFGNPETTSGGQALKFYASVRIDMRKIGNIQEGDEVAGTRHRARIVKNKVAPPFRTAEFDMMADSGISQAGGVLDVATDMGIIEKAGSFYKYKGDTIAQGRDNTRNLLESDSKFMNEIKQKVWDEIKAAKQAKKEKLTGADSDKTEKDAKKEEKSSKKK
ncbi:recombinase RecA [Candidatus Woesebacteria bacterium]|nr:recombinase RecA [Candidatus Woesebacteria bacterium]MCD8526821.1 recombinase RecA [Candidatus Woesebacteria bacterium]MCD8545921.1 recombinase RecA [Candidatus Woesebacteria bacterium]